jgi:2-polyprenyl-3-methyl-5-hydroxy-6-metoxy-1,4-benzoquinol methylase
MESDLSQTQHIEPFLLYDNYLAIFLKYGDPGEKYLLNSYSRFCITKNLILRNWDDNRRGKILDIGAHWLHNCLLYALDGFSVTAADLKCLGDMDRNPTVTGVAQEFNISTISYEDLSNPIELNELPENSFDLILFTEILEHITFNPVNMWKTLHRLLSPDGKIIITTPNYFYINDTIKGLLRFMRGNSARLTPAEILEMHTYGHHWKVYSAKDICDYFTILSPDFKINRLEYFNCRPVKKSLPWKLKAQLERIFPPCRENLYVEVSLREKNHGIVAQPHW